MQYSQRDQNLFKMVPSKHKLNSNARLFPCTAYFQQSTANTLPSPLHSAVPCVSIPVPAYQWELPGNLQIRNILCFLSPSVIVIKVVPLTLCPHPFSRSLSVISWPSKT